MTSHVLLFLKINMHSWLVVEVSQIESGNIWFDSSRVLKLSAAALPS